MFLSINTDDPKMFGNSLAEEYMFLVQKKGFTREEIKELVLGSIEMSWMPTERKQQITAAFSGHPAWVE
jgi:adenosine deaminase